MLRRITILTVTALSLQLIMVPAARADLINVTGAEQYVAAGIGYQTGDIDHRFVDECIPDPPQGLGDADLNISLAQYGVSVSGSLASIFEEGRFTANGSTTTSSKWGDNPTEAEEVHGGSGSVLILRFTSGSSPVYLHVKGQINANMNGSNNLHPEETFAYVKLLSDNGGIPTKLWEVTMNGRNNEDSLPVDHGLWLEADQKYVLEASAESGTTAAPDHSGPNSREAGFSLTATIDEKDNSDKYFLKDYYLMDEGITWNYLQTYSDGHKDYEVFCIGRSEPINGTTSYKRWQFDSGELEWYDYSYESLAWTQEGLKLYKVVCSDGSYLTCDPPAIQLPASLRIGETFKHSCEITEYDSSGHIVDRRPYSIELTVEGIEDVEVLAGSFARCLKLYRTEFDEGQESELTYWLAPGIGEVKCIAPGDEERELIFFTGRGKTYCPAD